jgi:hypothetical protein
MSCSSPLKASLDIDGSITFSPKKAIQGLEPFLLPCGQCLACRLNKGKEKAVRAWHESRMHDNNIFLTLTYDEEHLKSPKLQYRDFQLFMKKLRKTVPPTQKIPVMVTGEYGEINKRPHFHALIFNYYPSDAKHERDSDLGHRIYTSDKIKELWGKGRHDFGDITIDSANYVARYAAKKLVHGHDQDHDYHPIHKTSSKNAIGKSWIEKYYKQTFANGYVVLQNGKKASIPRYYVDWYKKHHFDDYLKFMHTVRKKQREEAEQKSRREEIEFLSQRFTRVNESSHDTKVLWQKSKNSIRNTILKRKFEKLQENLKL